MTKEPRTNMPSSIERRLRELKVTLPTLSPPKANYAPYVISGNLLLISGQRPGPIDRPIPPGKVGGEVSVEDAYVLARSAAVRMLAVVKLALGSLDRVKRVLRLSIFINSTDSFSQHSLVANGCSDLLVELFGSGGQHARTAVGVNSLPDGIHLEIDAMLEISPAE